MTVLSKKELLDYLSTVNLGTKSDHTGRSVLYLLLRSTSCRYFLIIIITL